MKKGLISLAATIFLLSAGSTVAATWYDVLPGQVQFVRADGRVGFKGFFIQYTQNFPGDSGCVARDFAYISKSNDEARDMYATLLSAVALGATIRVATTGCDSIGNIIEAVAIVQ